tara:strand:+ start:129 stop:500 length:372 start_codon:yes stop_codon:yes gene_type:complete
MKQNKKKLSQMDKDKIVVNYQKEYIEAQRKKSSKSFLRLLFFVIFIVIIIGLIFLNKKPENILENKEFIDNKEWFEKVCNSKGFRKPTNNELKNDIVVASTRLTELNKCMIEEFFKANNIEIN